MTTPEQEIDAKIRRLFRFVGHDVEVATKYGTVYLGKLIAFDHHQNALLGNTKMIRKKMAPIIRTEAAGSSSDPNPVEPSSPTTPPPPEFESRKVGLSPFRAASEKSCEPVSRTFTSGKSF